MTGSHEPNDTTKAAIEDTNLVCAEARPFCTSKVNKLYCYRLVSGEYIVGEKLHTVRHRSIKLLDPMFYGIQGIQLGVKTMVPGAVPRDPANVVTIRREHIMCDMPPPNCHIMEVYCKATHRAFATNEIGERVEVDPEEFANQEQDTKKTKAKKVRPPK